MMDYIYIYIYLFMYLSEVHVTYPFFFEILRSNIVRPILDVEETGR